jgi:hypothetical protein
MTSSVCLGCMNSGSGSGVVWPCVVIFGILVWMADAGAGIMGVIMVVFFISSAVTMYYYTRYIPAQCVDLVRLVEGRLSVP